VTPVELFDCRGVVAVGNCGDQIFIGNQGGVRDSHVFRL
jgi:hypothetical protein